MNLLQGMEELEGQSDLGIVLFHAYTGSDLDVNLLSRKLNRVGYGVISPLFLGHKQDDIYKLVDTDVQVWADQARAAVEYMQGKYPKVMVFGLSMGGIFATWTLLQEELEVIAGGVFNSPILTPEPVNLDQAFSRYVKHLYRETKSEDWVEEKLPEIIRRHHNQLSSLDNFIQTWQDKLSELTKPIYVAQSLKDELISNRSGELLKEALVNAKVTFHEFPENTHVITVNRNRENFEESLLEFIQENLEEVN